MKIRFVSPLVYLCALVATILAFSSVHATRVLPVSLEALSELAGTVFSGRCISAETVLDPALGMKVTQVTFEVDRAVKGDPGRTVSVRMLGGDQGVPGMPRFEIGEEVVLFLYAESELGLTSPVGMLQGKFRVYTDKNGERLAVNGTHNRGLFRDLSPRARERLGTAAVQWNTREAIEPTALLDMVGTLAGGRR